ncbi:hypothetical protein J6590_064669 [Homalodisca vitripennis]|nr:hypothetical protein J6590_064669 [Homalodisca vitripennis]
MEQTLYIQLRQSHNSKQSGLPVISNASQGHLGASTKERTELIQRITYPYTATGDEAY